MNAKQAGKQAVKQIDQAGMSKLAQVVKAAQGVLSEIDGYNVIRGEIKEAQKQHKLDPLEDPPRSQWFLKWTRDLESNIKGALDDLQGRTPGLFEDN